MSCHRYFTEQRSHGIDIKELIDGKRASVYFSCIFWGKGSVALLWLEGWGLHRTGYTDLCGTGNVLLVWILSWAERMDLENEAAGEIVLS